MEMVLEMELAWTFELSDIYLINPQFNYESDLWQVTDSQLHVAPRSIYELKIEIQCTEIEFTFKVSFVFSLTIDISTIKTSPCAAQLLVTRVNLVDTHRTLHLPVSHLLIRTNIKSPRTIFPVPHLSWKRITRFDKAGTKFRRAMIPL